jgi:hypothetical protein
MVDLAFRNQASVEHNKLNVLPVPVGLSSKAFCEFCNADITFSK